MEKSLPKTKEKGLEANLVKFKKSKKNVFLSRLKRRLLARHLWLIRLSLLGGIFLSLFIIIFLLAKIFNFFGINRYFYLAKNFIFTPQAEIKSLDQRTNILILGKAGEGYTAPDLTDTMILASISHKREAKIVLISLPRDIWLPDLRTKLNSVYYWGNQRKEKGGIILSKSVVEEIVGVPIHYAVVLDFRGFVKIINDLGGVYVDVERSFEDRLFPIPGKEEDPCNGDPEFKCRYETVKFEKGRQLMDGETALKFARSRHSEDLNEGTDFARSKRQEQIIASVKDKILSKEILLSPKKLKELWQDSSNMIETDIPEGAQAVLARRLLNSRNNIETILFPENLLLNPPRLAKYDYLYVFIPKEDNWSGIHAWVKSVLP